MPFRHADLRQADLAEKGQPAASPTPEFASPPNPDAPVIENPPPNSGLGFGVTGGLDYASAYYFRGYLQANNGLILQPNLSLFSSPALAEAG